MFRAKFSSITLMLFLFLPFNVNACDDKACEGAYLSETKHHIANHVRRAETHKVERHAHAINRERRAYALYRHFHLMWFGDIGIQSAKS